MVDNSLDLSCIRNKKYSLGDTGSLAPFCCTPLTEVKLVKINKEEEKELEFLYHLMQGVWLA